MTKALSRGQLAVIRHLVRGLRSDAIAALLGLARKTVDSHITASYSHLGVDSRAELVAKYHSGELDLGRLDAPARLRRRTLHALGEAWERAPEATLSGLVTLVQLSCPGQKLRGEDLIAAFERLHKLPPVEAKEAG